MPEPSSEEDARARAQKLCDAGYDRELERAARLFTAPFYWFDTQREPGSRLLNSGTIFFVQTCERLLGVSAWHVFPEGYCRDRERVPALECQIGDLRFDPERAFIDGDQCQDVSTFAIEPEFVRALGRCAHHPAAWPPPPLSSEEIPLVAGYPGALRSEEDRIIRWVHLIGLLWCENPGTHHAFVEVRRESTLDRGALPAPPQNTPLGGCSGGPLFAMVNEPIWHWRVCGILSESPDFIEGVLTRDLSNVQPDGSVRRPIV